MTHVPTGIVSDGPDQKWSHPSCSVKLSGDGDRLGLHRLEPSARIGKWYSPHELVDFRDRHAPVRAVLQGQGDQAAVGVGWLCIFNAWTGDNY